MRKLLFVLLLLAGPVAFAQQDTSLNTILGQFKVAAKQLLIDKYYPQNIDTLYGGYLTTFDAEFRPTGNQQKMIVTQARNVWTTAKAAEFYHDTSFITMSKHGFYFLRDKMWDKEYGGFYSLVSREGEPISKMKEAYGNAFGIYALAALYKASGDTAVLEFAKKAFAWLEQHSHDPVYKGYFQHLERDGTPIKRPASTPSTSDLGYKDQNSSIHIIEALTELYSVWHDPLLRERLTEMLHLIRDTIVTEKGYLQLFLTPDWKPVTFRGSSKKEILAHRSLDHVSGGHDVETAYLLREASEALAIPDDVKTAQIGKKMVDHAINNVWDKKIGGLYDEGYYFTDNGPITIIADTKNWWAQAEALNTFLMFAQLYPNDRMHYLDLFKKEWNYCQAYLIDHEHGDWYVGGLDKQPKNRNARKADIWKGPYHCFRALSNCIKRMENWGNEMPGKTE